MLEQLSSSEFKYQRKTFLTFLAVLFGIGGGVFLYGGQGPDGTVITLALFALCFLSIFSYYLLRKTYIIFTTSGNEIAVKLDNVTQIDVDRFINTVEQCKAKRELVSKQNIHTITENDVEPEIFNEKIFEQLEKLGKLKESGILNEEEFQAQKKKLLK